MNSSSPRPGCLAYAKAGRDKGKWFIVLNVLDESYVYIVNGDTRRLEKPKKKKIAPLKLKPVLDSDIAKKLQCGECVTDFDIRMAIARSGAINKEETACPSRM